MKKELKTMNESLHLDQNYKHFLSGIKERLQTAQIRAALAANSELIWFYWELGSDLIEKQKNHQWGSGFLEQFSHDMRQAFPAMQGFSVTNLKRMRLFAEQYPNFGKSPQPVDQLPWGHIAVLLHKIKPHPNEAHERAVENALVTHIRDFLIELGQGFAFVGSQVPVTFDEQEFFIDLLFYHLKLRCFVVIELKATKFKPEHTAQLGFYLAVVDDQMRQEGDNKSIGILLCKSKNKVLAEYALQNINAPIGISEYELSRALPKELKTSLPTIEQIEAELNEIIKHSEVNNEQGK